MFAGHRRSGEPDTDNDDIDAIQSQEKNNDNLEHNDNYQSRNHLAYYKDVPVYRPNSINANIVELSA
jgi:hypothetical protein